MLTITQGQCTYPIYFENHLKVKEYIQTEEAVIITDSNVAPLYATTLKNHLNCQLLIIPAGECYKTSQTKEHIERQMFARNLNRNTTVIALGGGTVTDLAGFIAATFCRGLPLIHIPTTLLAMVDASIGGKNGINTSFGKNLIGTIYPPQCIIVDTQVLKSLPGKEIANGMIETIKHALIADAELFEEIENKNDYFISRSSQIKADIVSDDPLEKGKRRLLNFGHTVGHAIETQSRYSISHGEAIAQGLILESQLSHRHFGLPQHELVRIQSLISRYFPNPPQKTIPELVPFMKYDKKNLHSKPRFVALSSIGKPLPFNHEYCTQLLI